MDQLVDHLVAGDTHGFGIEVRDDPMPQYRVSYRTDVIDGDMESAIEHGAGFATEKEVLHSPRASAPTHGILHVIGDSVILNASRSNHS